jgi:hypothetical protein
MAEQSAEGATPIVGRGSSCLLGLTELLWPDFNSEDLERFEKKKHVTLRGLSLSSEERRKHVHGSFKFAKTEREREREREKGRERKRERERADLALPLAFCFSKPCLLCVI